MPAPDFKSLYEHERLITASLKSVFNADDIKALAPEDAASSFYKERPRVDVFLAPGARIGHWVITKDLEHPEDQDKDVRRENGWTGDLELVATTKANFDLHSAYIAAIRELASRLDRLDLSDADVSPVPLQYHEISELKTAGSASIEDTAKGAYQTTLRFEICFAIRSDAWPGGLR